MKFFKKSLVVLAIAFFFLVCCIKPALGHLIFGSYIFYLGIRSAFFLRKIQRKGMEAIGRIMEFQSDDDGYKIPVVAFTTQSGELISEKPSMYLTTDVSKFMSYKSNINRPVAVLYDPGRPQKFILRDEGGQSYFFPILILLVGLLFVGVGISDLSGYIKLG